MKLLLLFLSSASLASAQAQSAPEACAAPAAAAKDGKARVGQFDPLVLDLKGDKRAAAPGTCAHAINTKGTGSSGRAASADHAINTKGTAVAGRAASADHAINTKGTGVAGRAAAGPGGDCDDSDDGLAADSKRCAAGSSDVDRGCGDSIAAAVQPTKSAMAIKCKGTGAQ